MASPTDYMWRGENYDSGPEVRNNYNPIQVQVGPPPPEDMVQPTPYEEGPPTSGGGGFGGIMDFIKGLPGFDSLGINPNMIPWLATAMNQYNNSGKYMDLATKYADQMDPFGKQRGYYQDRLRQMTEDPNAYLQNSPDFKVALKQGIGALDSSMSAKGFAGSGHAAMNVMDYGSELGAKYLDRDRQSLMQMAGSQIGPAAAAALISEGMKGSINSQNDALASLTAGMSKPTSKSPSDLSLPDFTSPAGISKAVQALSKAGLSMPDIQKILGSGKLGSVLSDGRIFYGFKPDGTPQIGEGNQSGWPGEPEGGYVPEPPIDGGTDPLPPMDDFTPPSLDELPPMPDFDIPTIDGGIPWWEG